VKGQVGELLTRYGAIDLLWWDGYEWPEGIDIHGDDMESYVRGLQPNLVENDRYFLWGPHKPYGDFSTDFENKNPTQRPRGPWEQCDSLCGGWSYRGEVACKPTSHIIERLARNRAWGGNYLPDFGPRPDGTMSPKFYAACDEMAAWMKHSGISVFDVEPGPYPERSDAPVTTKGNVWYVHFLSRNQRTASLTVSASEDVQNQQSATAGPGSTPKAARLLRTGEQVAWKKEAGKVVLTLPGEPATDLDEVVEVKW